MLELTKMPGSRGLARSGVVMVGTRMDSRGGIASVVRLYRIGKLFDAWPIVYVPTHAEGSTLFKVRLALQALGRVLWHCLLGRVRLLHVHLATRASFWRKLVVIAMVSLFRRPFILHLHSGRFADFYDRDLGAIGHQAARWMFRRAVRVIVLSREWERWATQAFPGARTAIVNNPVVIPRNVSSTRDACSLLYLGRLDAEKGIYELLVAMAKLREKFPAVRLLCAGDGEFKQVVQRATDLNLSGCVEMLGWVEGEEKVRLLDRATVLVLPSYKEGVPMSILEAMAHGLPVVATAVGGVPDIIRPDVDGVLVTPGDAAALAAAIERLLSDEGLRARLASTSRARAIAEFSIEKVVERLGAVYAELGVQPCSR